MIVFGNVWSVPLLSGSHPRWFEEFGSLRYVQARGKLKITLLESQTRSGGVTFLHENSVVRADGLWRLGGVVRRHRTNVVRR
jgi:hypothetical protein